MFYQRYFCHLNPDQASGVISYILCFAWRWNQRSFYEMFENGYIFTTIYLTDMLTCKTCWRVTKLKTCFLFFPRDRDGACIDKILDHGADVYGLTTHPQRPFVVASCSRDSTVRIWSLSTLFSTIQIRIIAGKPMHEVIAPTGED